MPFALIGRLYYFIWKALHLQWAVVLKHKGLFKKSFAYNLGGRVKIV
jgi:hypothetical protein